MPPEPSGDHANPLAPSNWGGLFRLLSCHGTYVHVSKDSRAVGHGHGPAIDLLGCRLPGRNLLAFMAEDGGPLQLSLGPLVRTAQIVVVSPQSPDGGGKGGMADTLSGLYLAASPGGTMVANRIAVMEWETFELDCTKAWQTASSRCINRMAKLRTFSTLRNPILPAFDHDRTACRDALEFAAAGLAPAAVQALVADAEQRADFPGWLALLEPDPWLTASEIDLARWLRDRVSPNVRRPAAGARSLMSPELDFLANVGGEGQIMTAGHAISKLHRARVVPRRRACVVATLRDEGPFLVDWVAHHLALGFEHFFLYSNNCADGSDEILQALDGAGVVTWIRNAAVNGPSPQYKAYGDMFGRLPDILDYEWALVIDLDEYFVLDHAAYPSLEAFLDMHSAQGSQAIVLSWLMFGPDGQPRWTDAPVTERFTRRATLGPAMVKSLVQPRLASHSHCHFPRASRLFPLAFVDASGRPHPGDPTFFEPLAQMPQGLDAAAWINHYWFKSAEEFIVRRTHKSGGQTVVGPSLITPRYASLFIAGHEAVDVVQDLRVARVNALVAPVRQRLLENPAIRAAHASAVDIYRKTAPGRVQANLGADDPEVRKLAGLAMAAGPAPEPATPEAASPVA